MGEPKCQVTEHPVMRCPCCDQTITAKVHVKPTLGQARVGDGYSIKVPVHATIERFHVEHVCTGPPPNAFLDALAGKVEPK